MHININKNPAYKSHHSLLWSSNKAELNQNVFLCISMCMHVTCAIQRSSHKDTASHKTPTSRPSSRLECSLRNLIGKPRLPTHILPVSSGDDLFLWAASERRTASPYSKNGGNSSADGKNTGPTLKKRMTTLSDHHLLTIQEPKGNGNIRTDWTFYWCNNWLLLSGTFLPFCVDLCVLHSSCRAVTLLLSYVVHSARLQAVEIHDILAHQTRRLTHWFSFVSAKTPGLVVWPVKTSQPFNKNMLSIYCTFWEM